MNTNIGELIAEKWFNGDTHSTSYCELSDLVNQEVEKVYGKPEKTLESETPVANEVVNTETGLAPCPFCGLFPKIVGGGMWFSVQCSGALCGDEPTCQVQPRT